MNANRSVNGLRFTGTAPSTLSGGSILTIGNSGIDNQSATGAKIVSAPLLLGAAQSFTNAGTLTISNTVGNGGFLLTLAGTGASGSVSGVISGTGGLTKSGSGTWTLSANNTYTGVTTVNAGTLAFGAGNVLGTGAVTVDGSTAVLNMGNNRSDTVGTVTIANGGSITGTGNSTLTSTGTFELESGTVTARLGGAGIALNKTTGGTVTLSGANTYTGLTTISAGTLAYGANNVISTGGVTVNGGTLNIANFSDTVGAVTLSSGSIVGTTGVLTGSSYTVQSGSISAILGGSGTLTKTTGGTVTLSGANTYTGATTISAGTLSVSASNNLGSGAGSNTLAIAGGATLLATGTFSTSRGVSLTSDTVLSNIEVAAGEVLTLSGVVSSNGRLAKSGDGTLVLSGNNTFGGGSGDNVTMNAGVLQISTNANLGDTDNSLIFDGGTLRTTNAGAITINRPIRFDAGYGTIDVSNAGGNTTLSGLLTGSGGFTKIGDGTLTITGTSANTFAGVTTVLDGTLALNGGGGAANNALIVGDIVVGDNVNPAGTANLTIGSTGQISNSSVVTVNSSGVFAVQTALEEVGTWDVRGGTITSSGAGQIWVGSGGVVSSGNVQGTISASTNLANGFAQFNVGNGSQAVDLRVTGVISDSEGTQNPLTKIGAGTLEFAAANTYGGGTTVSAGTLYVTNASGSATGTGRVTVNSGATLAGTGRIASTVTGAGAEVTIAAGAHIAPGVNAGDGANAGVGTLTVVAQNVDMSGTYDWQVGGAQTMAAANTGGSGSFRDFINVTGSLAFNDATIRIDDTASFSGFNPAGDYSWLIASGSAGASVNGTTTFDTSQFSFSGGFFSLGVVANNIYLNYSAVPEPSTWAMGLLALAAGGFYVQRRRRQARMLSQI